MGFVSLCISFVLLLQAHGASCKKRTTPTTDPSIISSYESIHALDEYGESRQVERANQAASLHGQLIAGIVQPDSVWIVTPLLLKHHQANVGSKSVVSRLSHTIVWTACGIASDKLWLEGQLREFCKQCLERFDTVQNVSYCLQRLLRSFWNYNADALYPLPCQPEVDPLSRPLGLCSMVVTCGGGGGGNDANNSNNNAPTLERIDASGTITRVERVCCMGQQSEALHELLSQSHEDSIIWTRESLVQVFRQLKRQHNNNVSGILLERIHASQTDGSAVVSRETIPL